jgi:hypothetical protein
MKLGAVALPVPSVPTSTAFAPLEAKVPLGPLPGAAKVTAIPASGVVIGQLFEFTSVTRKFVPKGVPSFALCGVPATSVSVVGGL